MDKKRVVVVCPGRGTYTRETSGYLDKYGEAAKEHIIWMDQQREIDDMQSISSLDSEPFKSRIHMAGENASTLIFACSMSDYLSINKEKYEIVSRVDEIHKKELIAKKLSVQLAADCSSVCYMLQCNVVFII